MLLACKACEAPLKSDDVDLRHGIATCSYCNAVMQFSELSRRTDGAAAEGGFVARGEVPLPAGIVVEDWGGALRIVRRWFSPVAFFLVFFCIAWNAFLVFWYSMAFSTNAPWIFKVFPIGHLAVGVGLTYFTIALFVNKTVLIVEAGQLRVYHGPLPWFGNKTVDAGNIDQLYCQKKVHHGEDSSHTSYNLHAVTQDGKKVKIASGMNERDQALYIEQQLERHLGIEDRAVPGELRR